MTNIYTKLAKLLNVAKITDDYKYSNDPDLEINEFYTADGYDVHVMTDDSRHIQFDYEVYYYVPNFNEIINRIKDLRNSNAIVFVGELETYLPEYEVENYIEQHPEYEVEKYIEQHKDNENDK